jgi:antirestriction protein ArdC
VPAIEKLLPLLKRRSHFGAVQVEGLKDDCKNQGNNKCRVLQGLDYSERFLK